MPKRHGDWTYRLRTRVRCGCSEPRELAMSNRITAEARQDAAVDLVAFAERRAEEKLDLVLLDVCPRCGEQMIEIGVE